MNIFAKKWYLFINEEKHTINIIPSIYSQLFFQSPANNAASCIRSYPYASYSKAKFQPAERTFLWEALIGNRQNELQKELR